MKRAQFISGVRRRGQVALMAFTLGLPIAAAGVLILFTGIESANLAQARAEQVAQARLLAESGIAMLNSEAAPPPPQVPGVWMQGEVEGAGAWFVRTDGSGPEGTVLAIGEARQAVAPGKRPRPGSRVIITLVRERNAEWTDNRALHTIGVRHEVIID